jgi:hypothetical protein
MHEQPAHTRRISAASFTVSSTGPALSVSLRHRAGRLTRDAFADSDPRPSDSASVDFRRLCSKDEASSARLVANRFARWTRPAAPIGTVPLTCELLLLSADMPGATSNPRVAGSNPSKVARHEVPMHLGRDARVRVTEDPLHRRRLRARHHESDAVEWRKRELLQTSAARSTSSSMCWVVSPRR